MRQSTKGNVLIISPFFSPSATVGAKRFSFLSKYLSGDFNVHVLSLKETGAKADNTLPIAENVHRVGAWPPFREDRSTIVKRIWSRLWWSYLSVVDEHSGWILPGTLKGLEVVRGQRIDLIVATGPPFSSTVLASILSRITGKKLILDYRDPWPTFRWSKLNRIIEKWVIRRASAIVFCTDIMMQRFIDANKTISPARTHVITNGHDAIEKIMPISLKNGKEKTILYAGNFYGQRRLTLILEPLLELINEGSISLSDLTIHVFGSVIDEDLNFIEKHNLRKLVEVHDFVDHSTIIKYMKGADVLFLPSGSDVSYALPFKAFDYLSVKRPILALTPPESALSDFMKNVDCGELADINSSEEIKKGLFELIHSNKKYSFNGSEGYLWSDLANKYSIIIAGQLNNEGVAEL